ncbi:hypothetical protein NPIL_47191 [Nephila pilipes]|uniref:Uncharacterized protein n=1 Tax=Nephila pilipes TaxID=299642 RepID=A0A8X6U516_NEPPI|nr:hypothetical protein NPIL_47191 [Nephila pilipes]
MDAYIKRNALDIENHPNQDRIKAKSRLNIRRDLTGKILDLFPCPDCNNHIFTNVNFRKTAKGLGFKIPSLKKKNIDIEPTNFTFRSPVKKAKIFKEAGPPKIQITNKFDLLKELDDQDQTTTPPQPAPEIVIEKCHRL